MSQHRTLQQKKQAEARRLEKMSYSLSGLITPTAGSAVLPKITEKIVKQNSQVQSFVLKDLIHSLVSTAIIFGILFGLYFYSL